MIEEVISGDTHKRIGEPRQGSGESFVRVQIKAKSQTYLNPIVFLE